MGKGTRNKVITASSAMLYAFLWAPLLVIGIYSFNSARFGAAWQGFTLEWYRTLGRNDAARQAIYNTVVLAVSSTIIATVLGTLLGYALGRFRFRGCDSTLRLLQVPMLTPDIVFAVALVLLFAMARRWTPFFDPGLKTMILGHVSFQVPFVALVVRARAAGLDPAMEEAARDLGASAGRTFWHVTLPLLRPGIIAGALLAFTLSLDDFAVSFFTSGPGSTTLPILIYASARRGITPDINALSTMFILTTICVLMIAHGTSRMRRSTMSSVPEPL
jgi:spermidine/putrescine transport system permease protein